VLDQFVDTLVALKAPGQDPKETLANITTTEHPGTRGAHYYKFPTDEVRAGGRILRAKRKRRVFVLRRKRGASGKEARPLRRKRAGRERKEGVPFAAEVGRERSERERKAYSSAAEAGGPRAQRRRALCG
jgi:hypothetical protein